MPSSDPTPSPTAAPSSEGSQSGYRRASVAIVAWFAMMAASCSGSDTAGAPATTAASTTTLPTTTLPTTTLPTTTLPTTMPPDVRALPTSAANLATDLDTAERAIRDPDLASDEAAAWGRRLQRLYGVLAQNEDWASDVVSQVDPAVAADVESNLSARQNLSALVTSTRLSDVLPAWRIRDPLPADELMSHYREAEAATDVAWEILASIHLIETRMGRIEGLSTAGAVGPMQFLPSTWEACCEGDPRLDRDAIMGAAVYLTQVGAPDDIDAALFSYNRSRNYVEAVKDYADVMARNDLAYRGYHAFEVFFRSSAGLVVLRSGYEEPEPVDATAWIAEHPDQRIPD